MKNTLSVYWIDHCASRHATRYPTRAPTLCSVLTHECATHAPTCPATCPATCAPTTRIRTATALRRARPLRDCGAHNEAVRPPGVARPRRCSAVRVTGWWKLAFFCYFGSLPGNLSWAGRSQCEETIGKPAISRPFWPKSRSRTPKSLRGRRERPPRPGAVI